MSWHVKNERLEINIQHPHVHKIGMVAIYTFRSGKSAQSDNFLYPSPHEKDFKNFQESIDNNMDYCNYYNYEDVTETIVGDFYPGLVQFFHLICNNCRQHFSIYWYETSFFLTNFFSMNWRLMWIRNTFFIADSWLFRRSSPSVRPWCLVGSVNMRISDVADLYAPAHPSVTI